jgi:hypothetical protein
MTWGLAHTCFHFLTEAAPLVAVFDEWVPRTSKIIPDSCIVDD